MRWLNSLFLMRCLVLLVLPLQAAFAGTGAPCHSTAVGMQVPAARHAAHLLAVASVTGPSAGSATSAVSAKPVVQPAAQHHRQDAAVGHSDTGTGSNGAAPGALACKVCSHCCLMALAGVLVPAVHAPVLGAARFPEPAPLHRSNVPTGLERPPRTTLI